MLISFEQSSRMAAASFVVARTLQRTVQQTAGLSYLLPLLNIIGRRGQATMNSTFGLQFVHTSPLSSLPHDPVVTLASNCIRDFFGPAVQTVADCLQSRGGSSSLSQLVAAIRNQCRRVWNEERERLLVGSYHRVVRQCAAKGPISAGFVVETEHVRDALLVLLQHGLVSVEFVPQTTYRFHVHRARLLIRYPRFVEYAKKALDETAAALVEELLIHGRMTTVDAVVTTVNHLHELGDDDAIKSDRYTTRQAVVESFRRLVEGGFIESVPPLKLDAEEEVEFEGEMTMDKKATLDAETTTAIKVEHQMQDMDDGDDDPAVVSLLSQGPYRTVLPRNTVWRVNVNMFHHSLRAFSLGRLVVERFGHKVQSAGSMVTAALKLAAHKQHALKNPNYEESVFSPPEIIHYLPKPVQQALEKKPSGILVNLSRALVELGSLTNPPEILSEAEQATGNPNGGKFEISTRQLVNYLQGQIYHQVILDSHGEVAARVCSILNAQGHLEADVIAEYAMVPAKDTREILHQLYRANHITLLTLQPSKQYNPANMIYLWTVDRKKMQQTVTANVCRALTNIRLRRQHEVEVGKAWMERSKEEEVNEHEIDKENYTKFCQGLERLDNAALQLDETLMVLLDF